MTPEEEPFDIQDFSVASPWEHLVAAIEARLREWQADEDGARPESLAPLQLSAPLAAPSAREFDIPCVLTCRGQPGSAVARNELASDGEQLTPLCRQLLSCGDDSLRRDTFAPSLVDRLQRWFGLSSLVLLAPQPPRQVLDASEMASLQGAPVRRPGPTAFCCSFYPQTLLQARCAPPPQPPAAPPPPLWRTRRETPACAVAP